MSTTITAPRVEVVSAIIIRGGFGARMLLQQRSESRDFSMKWETPGGKVEMGETHRQALRRELAEELGISGATTIGPPLYSLYFDPPETASPLRLTFYQVDIGEQTPRCLDAMGLGWFDHAAVLALDMTPGTAALRLELAALLPAQIASKSELATTAATRAAVIDVALRSRLGTGKSWVQLTTAVTNVVGGSVNADEFSTALRRIGATRDAAGKLYSLPLSGAR